VLTSVRFKLSDCSSAYCRLRQRLELGRCWFWCWQSGVAKLPASLLQKDFGCTGTWHSPCTLSTPVTSRAEHEVALWEGRILVYGRRGAGAVQSSLHGLKSVTQSGEWNLGLESSLARHSYSSRCSFDLVISGLPLARGVEEPSLLSPGGRVGERPFASAVGSLVDA